MTLPFLANARRGRRGRDRDRDRDDDEVEALPELEANGGSEPALDRQGRVFGYEPFTQPLFIPEVLRPTRLDPAPGASNARIGSNAVFHGIAREFDGRPTVQYELFSEETAVRLVPGGPDTLAFTYRDGTQREGSGRTPGPTIVANHDEAVVLRSHNNLSADRVSFHHDVETSVHLHGGHAPAHSDGYPNFYVLAGEARDYYYPMRAPSLPGTGLDGPIDETWIPTTMWYHDHAMDVTGFNVSRGLAGFCLLRDDVENELIGDVLPAVEHDVGLALTDQQLDADGQLLYDWLDHNGRVGDVFTVNGVVQPVLEVERRKYRFRILNASNARYYELRLSSGQPFTVVGTDSWLIPEAIDQRTLNMCPGQRHDVIVDFRDAPDEVFLENIMFHDDGRRGEIDPSKRTIPMKFRVRGARVSNDVSVEHGTTIRGYADRGGQWAPISEADVVRTRVFEFERSHGAWVVNGRFFNPRRADAVPELESTERWIFENSSGGWWHPIHMHLEGFQVVRRDSQFRPVERFNRDLVNLEGGDRAEVLVRFRGFEGPFAFHCHNVEHEDMRMMGVHDPKPRGVASTMDGVTQIDPQISGVPLSCETLEEEGRILFDVQGDVDRLEGRGVGFPHCEFDGGDDD